MADTEAKFSTLFRHSPAAMVVLDWYTGKLIEFNDACLTLIGGNREELERLFEDETWQDRFWSDPEQLAEIRKRSLEDGDVSGVKVALRHADGHEIPVLYFGRRVQIDERDYSVTQLVDLSDLRRMERELAESEARFTQLFYASPIPSVLIKAGEMAISDANDAMVELFGYKSSELVEMGNFSAPWVEPNQREELIARMRTGRRVEVVADIRNKQGEVLPVEVSGSAILINGKRFALLSFMDLRASRAAEMELMAINDRLEEAQELAHVGDFVWNLDTDVFEGSRECMILLGFPDERVVKGAQSWATVHEDDREKVQSASSHSGRFEHESRINPADGSPMRYIRTKGTIVREAGSGERIARGVLQDVSDQEQTAQEKARLAAKLQESQRMESLGQLAGGVAHDFNNLLAGILGNADFALTESGLPPKVKDRLNDVIAASKRAAELTHQLLAYSGKGRFVIQSVSLTEIVEDVANLLAISVAENCKLEFHLSPDLPEIEADGRQIRQTIINLVSNASEAIEHGSGVVVVSTAILSCDYEYLAWSGLTGEIAPGTYVILEVSDNGSGMDTQSLKRIFEPFFTTRFTGRGLGLSAVQGIVKGHSGAIWVASEPGKGSTFKVLLPVSDRTSIHQSDEKQAAVGSDSNCILVVDDEAAVRGLVERVLQQQGYQVLMASNGLEAVGVFEENATDVDLVLLDLTMPDLDGEQTFRRLRTINPDVKAVLMSGYNEQDAIERFESSSLSGFLAKPFLVADLLRKVESGLA